METLIEFYDNVPFPDPKKDGIDHINIYSRGRTKLGRMLSNFSPYCVCVDSYGTFASGEGFWYWYITGQQHERLRELVGYQAKKYGQQFEKDRIDKDGMTQEMIEVMQSMMIAKVLQHEEIYNEVLNSDPELCFTHYYVYDGIPNDVDCSDWYIDTYEQLRMIIQDKQGI